MTRHFCGTCGGRLYTSGSLPGDVVMIRAVSFDEPNSVTPQNVIYSKDAIAWDHFDPALKMFDTYAPFDEATLAAMNSAARGI